MPPRRTTPQGYDNARRLRKAPTPAEARLWSCLRGSQIHGVNFRRQHAIGRYVVDFCSIKGRLIIELDGSAHIGQTQADVQRTVDLESRGYHILRFWNGEVLNDIEGVRRKILDALSAKGQGRTD